MANEAVLYIETAPPLPFTCADAQGIEKGAILKLTDDMTAIINSGGEDQIAGIAASEKIASDGKTHLAVFREGIFIVYCSGSVTQGQALATTASYVNFVSTATATAVGGETLGIALSGGTNGQTIYMELKPGCNNTAYS